MTSRIQDISFRISRYFRPLEPWHCGGQVEGKPCVLGPDKKGRCRASSACKPDLENRTWTCTRSDLMGGACDAGPGAHGECGQQSPPCTPVRNLQARKRRIGWLACAAVLAMTALVISIDNWRTPVNPGELSKHHAALGVEGCSACHEAAQHARSLWIPAIFSGNDVTAEQSTTQSINDSHDGFAMGATGCQGCHALGPVADTVTGDIATGHANNPHSLPADALAALSVQAETVDVAESGTSLLLKVASGLRDSESLTPSCASCHTEHDGLEANITEVSDQQCGICHTQKFDSFAAHPEFSDYPAAARTPIIFSHNSHFGKHFAESNDKAESSDFAPGNCTVCHQTDAIGRKMELTSFDRGCSSCHLDQIAGTSRAADKGIAMLSIPTLDLETLEQRGVSVGEWPDTTDADMTPLNWLVLGAINPDLVDKLEQLQDLELYDLTEASDAELRLVYQMAWGLKQAWFEMQRGGAAALRARLHTVMGGNAHAEDSRILGLLSPDLIDLVVAQSFPQLDAEVSEWLREAKPEFKLLPAPIIDTAENQSVATVQAGDQDDSDWLNDVAGDAGSDDDDWLAEVGDGGAGDDDAWLEDIAEEDTASDDDDWLSDAAGGDDDALSDDDWLDDAAGEDEAAGLDDDDWLADVSDDEENAFALDDVDDEFAAQDWDDDEAEESGQATTVALLEQLSKEDRASAGGWYFEDFYLRYRPSGHADPTLVAWMEKLTAQPSGVGVTLQQAILGDSAPGSCAKCHSVEVAQNDAGNTITKVNWLGLKTPPAVKDFNRFSHKSHYAAPSAVQSRVGKSAAAPSLDVQGCKTCHVQNPEADSSLAYEQDASDFESDFHGLDKQQCATCHEVDTALSTCTQCHNYHIGERQLTLGDSAPGNRASSAAQIVDDDSAQR